MLGITGERSAATSARTLGPVLVFVSLAALFLVTASYGEPPSVDPATNAISSYVLAHRLSPIAHEFEEIVADPRSAGRVTWLVASPNGPVSQYPPGAALVASPIYALATDEGFEVQRGTVADRTTLPLPDIWPASATAAILTAAAMALLHAILTECGHGAREATVIVAVFGLGTATWTVAADALWQHGPAMFFIALAMHSGLRGRHRWAAGATWALVLTRPVAVTLAMGILLGLAHQTKSRRLAAHAVGGAAGGLASLVLYNRLVFGDWSISGGYPSELLSNVVHGDFSRLATNVAGALFSADRGVATWSPFIVMALFVVPFVFTRIEPWMRVSLIGAGLYVAVQYLANRYSGGSGFSYYRYPLEPMTAMVPVLAIAGLRISRSPLLVNRVLFHSSIAWSILVHAIAAIPLAIR